MKTKAIIIILCGLVLLAGCNRSRQPGRNTTNRDRVERNDEDRPSDGGRTIIRMQNKNGVYYVPCKINGTEMEFIFDTGASDITMSMTEALFLYKQGKITDADFAGSQQYQVADGSIHEGQIVILKTVQIGNRELNDVRASIVDNMDAPLLLGQSALAKFGKISIDYDHNQIIFE